MSLDNKPSNDNASRASSKNRALESLIIKPKQAHNLMEPSPEALAQSKSKTYSLKSGFISKKEMMDKKYQVLGSQMSNQMQNCILNRDKNFENKNR